MRPTQRSGARSARSHGFNNIALSLMIRVVQAGDVELLHLKQRLHPRVLFFPRSGPSSSRSELWARFAMRAPYLSFNQPHWTSFPPFREFLPELVHFLLGSQ